MDLDTRLNRVERILRTLGTHNEPFLPKNVRTSLIDQLVDDVLDSKPRSVLIQDLLRNGCIGFNQLPDLSLIGALRDNMLMDSPDPAITDKIVQILIDKEYELLGE